VCTVAAFSAEDFANANVQFSYFGPDLKQLEGISSRSREVKTIPDAVGRRHDIDMGKPKLQA
jgi:hypothetical protein